MGSNVEVYIERDDNTATVLPQISRPPETEWSQERIESFPMLANALTRSNNNAELNAFYKDWDPQAYQQWVNIQYQQQHQQQQHANHLNQLLAHAFTRSRPINYESSIGKVYQWETLLPIIPRSVSTAAKVSTATIDLTGDEDSEAQCKIRKTDLPIIIQPRSILPKTVPIKIVTFSCQSPKTTLVSSTKTTLIEVSSSQKHKYKKRVVINNEESRRAFRIFIRQNYRMIKRMLGPNYSKDNLQHAFSKWWRHMVPAGRGFYQVLAKAGDNDNANTNEKRIKSGCRKRTESERRSESESATESWNLSSSVCEKLLNVKQEKIDGGNEKKAPKKDAKKYRKKLEMKDGKKVEIEGGKTVQGRNVKNAVGKHVKNGP